MIKAKHLTKITDINKLFIESVINEGDIVIDATMGNGYDTKYLAQKVGEEGFVYSFDIQEKAIKSTQKKIEKLNLAKLELIEALKEIEELSPFLRLRDNIGM